MSHPYRTTVVVLQNEEEFNYKAKAETCGFEDTKLLK
jgi:hypothetical protein